MYGLNGIMTGKVGNTVFAVRNGTQIARQYQPVVLNPKSGTQREARAKLKLMSALSAVVRDYIAIPRDGMMSPRNRFFKENYPLATYANDTASVALESVQLTKSTIAISGLTAARAQSGFSVQIAANTSLDRVIYVAVGKKSGTLQFMGAITKSADSTHEFRVTVPSSDPSVETVIYAYGVRFNTENAKNIYSALEAEVGGTTGKVIVTAMTRDSNVIPTATTAITVAAAE